MKETTYDRGNISESILLQAYLKAGLIVSIPYAATSGSDGCLRLSPSLNGQQKLIRWAADYTWEKHIAELVTGHKAGAKLLEV